MNKKLLLLSLLTGLSFIKADTTYIDTVAELGARVTVSEAKIKAYEAMLASNKTLLKQVCYNANQNYIKPAASSALNDYLVPGLYNAGHYAAMPIKYGAGVYMDNWMYTIPATVAAISIYTIYKARHAIMNEMANWLLRKLGRPVPPANGGNGAPITVSTGGQNNTVVVRS